jgi:hypothetical protein
LYLKTTIEPPQPSTFNVSKHNWYWIIVSPQKHVLF